MRRDIAFTCSDEDRVPGLGPPLLERPALRTTGDVMRWVTQSRPATWRCCCPGKAVRAFYATDSSSSRRSYCWCSCPTSRSWRPAWRSARRSGQPLTQWIALLFLLVLAYSWVVTMSALSIVRYMAPPLALLAVPLRRRSSPAGTRCGSGA